MTRTIWTMRLMNWKGCEGELGLFTFNREPKEMVRVLTRFQERLKKLPVPDLPPPSRQAVCVLAGHPDCWAVALGTYLLAKQSGFDLTFCYEDQPIPEAELYLVPSLKGADGLKKSTYRELIGRVKKGAQLYLSLDDSFVLEHEKVFGAQLMYRKHRKQPAEVCIGNRDVLTVPCGTKLVMQPTRAAVHLAEEDGTPVLLSASFGEGTAWLCTLPIESALASHAGTPEEPYYRIYQHFAAEILHQRILQKSHPCLCITEHMLSADKACCIIINHSTEPVKDTLALHLQWQTEDGLSSLQSDIPGNDWAYAVLKRR